MNDLVVSHDDPKKMDEFRKVVEKSMEEDSEEEISIFSHFHPEPNYEEEEVEDVFPRPDKKSVMPAWWNWRVANWGTKWTESYLEVMEDKGNTMHLSFQTAWSPPRGVIEKMVEQGFSTEFWYMEQGNDFWGYEVDGKEIHYGSPSDYFVDAWGNTYSEWSKLPEGAPGRGKKFTKSFERRINFETDETETTFYDTWEIEWTEDGAKSKEKALKLGIPEQIWNKCALGFCRGG